MTPQELRQLVANTASAEENSTDSLKYWRAVLPATWKGPPPRHWCGAFALWALKEALACPWIWEFRDGEGIGFLYRLPQTKTPDIGDICYMAKPYQHHAVLTAVGTAQNGTEYVISQDGNSGNSPGICEEHWRPRSKWTCFYSIEPVIKMAMERGA